MRRGSKGVGVRQLRRPRLHRGHRDPAELLPGEAGQGADDPCALPVHEGVEGGSALHRRQHQGQGNLAGQEHKCGSCFSSLLLIIFLCFGACLPVKLFYF